MKKPALFTTLILALCAADARAQTDANQFDLAMPSSTLVRRIANLNGRPAHELQGEGQWMGPTALREGRVDAVIDGQEGQPLWRLDALTTEYMPGVTHSARFVYGGLYGTLYALDGTQAAPILVQGEWARHGVGSPNGSLMALVFRSAPFPQNIEVLGTLTGEIQFFDDGSGDGPGAAADGGPSFAISAVQVSNGATDASGRRLAEARASLDGLRDRQAYSLGTIERMGSLAAANGMLSSLDSGLERPQSVERGNVLVARVEGTQALGGAQNALRRFSSDVYAGFKPSNARPNETASGISIDVERLGAHVAAHGRLAASDAGSPTRFDRVGTCGTKDAQESPSISGHRLPVQQSIGSSGATLMNFDGIVRVVYRVFD